MFTLHSRVNITCHHFDFLEFFSQPLSSEYCGMSNLKVFNIQYLLLPLHRFDRDV